MILKKIIGYILVLVGIILPIYLLISGVIQIVNAISPFVANELAFGVLKVIFCEMGGIPLIIGYHLLLMEALKGE